MGIRFWLFFLFLFSELYGSDFIRSIRTITIPDAPGAYNGSIIEYGDGYLLAFRHDTYTVAPWIDFSDHFQRVGLIKLDHNFMPIGNWFCCEELGVLANDPRLVQVGNEIFLIYVNAQRDNQYTGCTICVTKVVESEDRFILDLPISLKVAFQQPFEKNWVPFNYHNNLLLSYSIAPHLVLWPSLANGICATLASHGQNLKWNYGIIRGGTPAKLVDGKYLAFFHSSEDRAGTRIYHMGAYTFASEPPFNLTAISSMPFVNQDFYKTPHTPITWFKVLFPAGFVIKGNRIFVSYGENDGAIKIMEIDKAALIDSLRQL